MNTEHEKGSHSSSERAVEDLLSLNQLEYILQPDLSVVTSKTLFNQPSLQSEYSDGSSNVIKFVFNTGSQFIKRCALNFTLQVNSVDESQCYLKYGTDLISSVIITSRDGTELERCRDINKVARFQNEFQYKGDTGLYDNGDNNAFGSLYDNSGVVEYSIPLSRLSGIFRYAEDKCLPSFLASGLQVEIVLAPIAEAMYVNNPTSIINNASYGYTVTNPHVSIEGFTLSSSILLALERKAAKTGLDVAFESYQTFTQAAPNSTCTVEIRKSCSRALWVAVETRSNHNGTTNDTLRRESMPYSAIQARVGALYLPSQPYTNSVQLYRSCNDHFSKINKTQATFLSRQEFHSSPLCIFSFERDSLNQYPGMSLNSSRLAVISATFGSTATDREITCTLAYAKLVKVFLQSCSVLE